MTKFLTTLPATLSQPAATLSWDGMLCRITQEKKEYVYLVDEFPTDWDGRAFYFRKACVGSDPTEEGYNVFCARNGQDSTCECRGFERFGPCKHLKSAWAFLGYEGTTPEDLVNAEEVSVECPF
jgi:hypothetical protein